MTFFFRPMTRPTFLAHPRAVDHPMYDPFLKSHINALLPGPDQNQTTCDQCRQSHFRNQLVPVEKPIPT